jgi:hypothetical protein
MSSFIPPMRCQHCGNTNITSIYLAWLDKIENKDMITTLHPEDIKNKEIIEPSVQKKILNDIYEKLNFGSINNCCSNTILTLPS